MHVVQLTPTGSGCSIVIGDLPAQNQMAPGSMPACSSSSRTPRAARQELIDRAPRRPRSRSSTEPDGGTFFGFSDPDGNTWGVQELNVRGEHAADPEGPRRLERVGGPLTGRADRQETSRVNVLPPSSGR